MTLQEKMDPQVELALEKLLELLAENEVVQTYQKIAQQVEHHLELKKLEEDIKIAQKEAVNFAHYGKLEAAKQAKQKADALTEKLNQHPLVKEYRQALYEANDLLQYMTCLIEEKVNDALQSKGSD